MPTIRLTPSAYTLSSTSYLSVSSASNMYDDTDSTTYATVTNSRTSTTSYYIYLHDFNISDIPSAAVVTSFSVKLKARESGVSTSSSYRPYLVTNGSTSTSTYYGYCDALGTSVTTETFTLNCDWADIVSEGNDFSIRINCRRASRNTTSYVYIYGAEIEVTYTVPTSRTITTTLSGEGTIDPSGTTSTYDDQEFELTITPTDKTASVSATYNGTDITSQLVAHGTETSASTVLGNYTLVSGGFNGSGASYFSGIEGNGEDASTTTSNYYSSDSSTIAVFTYDMGITIPSNATVTRCYVNVSGHAESTSNSSEYMCAQLISGSTELTEELNFKSIGTSNSIQTLECTDMPTPTQLANAQLQCRLGYYGGAINGATLYVEYDVPSGTIDHYTYTFTVSEDATIAVTIGSVVIQNTFYRKANGSWTELSVTTVYKKVNGAWVQQSDWTNAFDPNTNYVYISN